MPSHFLSHSLGAADLRPLEPWQAEELAAFADREREHLAPFLPWAVSVTDADSARSFLQRYADGTAADGPRIYALYQGEEMVGGVLFRIFDTRQSLAEVGAWLAASAQGQGLITRAVEVLLEWAFVTRGIRRVEWRCVPTNGPSIAVARRLGMTLDGTLRQSFEHAGRVHDAQVWALLAEEWAGRTPWQR